MTETIYRKRDQTPIVVQITNNLTRILEADAIPYTVAKEAVAIADQWMIKGQISETQFQRIHEILKRWVQ